MPLPSVKEKKRQQAGLQEAKLRVAEKFAKKRAERDARRPVQPPRYDNVFFEGIRMIGGYDTVLPGLVLGEDLDFLLRATRAAWPQAVVESDDGTVSRMGDALRLRWDAPCEFFIYENRAAYESWTTHGLTDENANTIITVTVEPDCISFVVGDATGPTASIVREAVEALTKNRWFFSR